MFGKHALPHTTHTFDGLVQEFLDAVDVVGVICDGILEHILYGHEVLLENLSSGDKRLPHVRLEEDWDNT